MPSSAPTLRLEADAIESDGGTDDERHASSSIFRSKAPSSEDDGYEIDEEFRSSTNNDVATMRRRNRRPRGVATQKHVNDHPRESGAHDDNLAQQIRTAIAPPLPSDVGLNNGKLSEKNLLFQPLNKPIFHFFVF